jgi:diacylglycerol kinase
LSDIAEWQLSAAATGWKCPSLIQVVADRVCQSDQKSTILTRMGFAWAGLAHAVRAERSVRIHMLALLAVLAAMVLLRPEPVWWGMVTLASSGVLAAELFNTAVEHLADLSAGIDI